MNSVLSYGSVCSGIGCADIAFHEAGWRCAFVSEIEPFPCAVLAERFPGVPNLGDMTTIAARVTRGEVEAPDGLVGGTPCQSFSVAGLRGGLADARGNLALEYVRLADAIDAVRRSAGKPGGFFLWENVPGVLSMSDNAFGAFLGGLVGSDAALVPPSGRRWGDAGVVHGPARVAAWRVLDAQHFGLAQRRRRVFVLAHGGAGAWAAADALLPLVESVRWHPAPGREERKAAPVAASRRAGDGRRHGGARAGHGLTPFLAEAASTQDRDGFLGAFDVKRDLAPHGAAGTMRDVASPLTAAGEDGTGRGTPMVPVVFHPTQDPISSEDVCHALGIGSRGGQASAAVALGAIPIAETGKRTPQAATAMAVRRLTPLECERLQGLPDAWTAIVWREKEAADGPRYRAIGNGMAVPCIRYIVDQIGVVLGRAGAAPERAGRIPRT